MNKLENAGLIKEENAGNFRRHDYSSMVISRKILNAVEECLKPVLSALRISPFQAVVLSLGISIFSAIQTVKGNWSAGFGLYVLGFVLSDGILRAAQAQKTATFFDYFLNGFIGRLNLVVLRCALCWLIWIQSGISPLLGIGIASLLITPYALFIFDRYAAFTRWIREETEIYLKPEVPAVSLANLVYEAERIALVLSLFYFSLGMWIYFLLNSIFGMVFMIYHIRCANKKMRIDNLQSSLKRYKREDGNK